jgi:hypothetical protein
MNPDLLALLLLLLLVTVLVGAAIYILRQGARDEFVTLKPLRSLVFWTLGLQLCLWFRDWLTSELGARSLVDRLGIAALVFAGLTAIWFAGFFFGRWRGARRAGQLSNIRSRQG